MFTGSKAFTAVLNATHHMLSRQAMLLHACSEPLTEEDAQRLDRHGVKESALGSAADGTRVPAWLEKWTSLVLKWTELELRLLPEALMKPNPKQPMFEPYTQRGAEIEAAGMRTGVGCRERCVYAQVDGLQIRSGIVCTDTQWSDDRCGAQPAVQCRHHPGQDQVLHAQCRYDAAPSGLPKH